MSTCSFHATKLFHTGEGGAMFCDNLDLYNTLFCYHNFGHDGPEQFQSQGINAKMSELQAAMGLAVLPYMENVLNERKRAINVYQRALNFKRIKTLKVRENTKWNYSYYPVVFDSEIQLKKAIDILNKNNVYPRRYFYPSLNKLPYLDNVEMPISETIAQTILCLPLYHDLEDKSIHMICKILNTIE